MGPCDGAPRADGRAHVDHLFAPSTQIAALAKQIKTIKPTLAKEEKEENDEKEEKEKNVKKTSKRRTQKKRQRDKEKQRRSEDESTILQEMPTRISFPFFFSVFSCSVAMFLHFSVHFEDIDVCGQVPVRRDCM